MYWLWCLDNLLMVQYPQTKDYWEEIEFICGVGIAWNKFLRGKRLFGFNQYFDED